MTCPVVQRRFVYSSCGLEGRNPLNALHQGVTRKNFVAASGFTRAGYVRPLSASVAPGQASPKLTPTWAAALDQEFNTLTREEIVGESHADQRRSEHLGSGQSSHIPKNEVPIPVTPALRLSKGITVKLAGTPPSQITHVFPRHFKVKIERSMLQ